MLQTVELMVATHGLALHHRNQQVIDSVRGVPERVGDHIGAGPATPVVAEVVEFPFTAIELPGEPAICRLDAKDRFHLAGTGVLLGWAPGDDLAVEDHGRWLVLRRAVTRGRRHVPR
jgi:hypothetical protein